jgi:hypothetical protein
LAQHWRAGSEDVEVRHLVSNTGRAKREQRGIAS